MNYAIWYTNGVEHRKLEGNLYWFETKALQWMPSFHTRCPKPEIITIRKENVSLYWSASCSSVVRGWTWSGDNRLLNHEDYVHAFSPTNFKTICPMICSTICPRICPSIYATISMNHLYDIAYIIVLQSVLRFVL